MISWAETNVTAMDPRVWSVMVRSINIHGESIYRQEIRGLRSAARISGIDYREEKSNRKSMPALFMLKSRKKKENLSRSVFQMLM